MLEIDTGSREQLKDEFYEIIRNREQVVTRQ